MAFDLAIDGVALFGRLDGVLAQEKISRDPLSGVIDGVNRIFHTTYHPILSSGSVLVYEGVNLVAGIVDVDTGEVSTGSAPNVQPMATYTFTPYSLTQQLTLLLSGFYKMETEWVRGWRVVDSGGNPADENSDFLYVQDTNGADPLTGVGAQTGFYMACCRWAYLMTRLTGAASTDFDWRETVRGMAVSKSRRPQNLSAALDMAQKDIDRALQRVEDAAYSDGSNLGGFVGGPMTQGYVESLEWQTWSGLAQTRSQRGYSRSIFPLSV